MMSVYKFEKSFLERLNDFKLILDDDTSHVKISFIDFLETTTEPGGYSAIWKISKASCEDLKIKYPCEVYGSVVDTNFGDLLASFRIESVQDDSISLPECLDVPLEDIYPTIEQENSALNVDLTADCLDRFRFFFQKIYMPFDDSERNFVNKLMLPRLKLFFDLKNKLISKGLSSHIRSMINEVKFIQAKKEQLEVSFDESLEEIDISRGESKDKARKLLELHLKMNKIKAEFEILINPEMRAIYEDLRCPVKNEIEKLEKTVFAVTKPGTVEDQVQVLEKLRKKVTEDQKIHWLSLNDCVAASVPSSEIYIPAGSHEMKFLEYFDGNISLTGLTQIPIKTFSIDQEKNYAKISANEPEAVLFAVDGDLSLENLIIDCELVKTGFLVKGGKLTIKNCVIYGTTESSVTEGFAVNYDATVYIENCVVKNFATGISISDDAKVEIKNSIVENCGIGVSLMGSDAMVGLEESKILNCSEHGIIKTMKIDDKKGKTLDFNDRNANKSFLIDLQGDSNIFDGNKSNIFIAPKFSEESVISAESIDDIEMEA